MIEDNVIKYIDLDETMQNLDSYSKKGLLILFQIFETMLSHKSNGHLTFIFLKIIFFLQVITISSIGIPENITENDYAIKFFNELKSILIPQKFIVDKNSFLTCYIIALIICFLILFCLIYLIVISFIKKKLFTFPIQILNLLNLILNNYGICPLINIMMTIIHCEKGKHKYLEIKCYQGKHLFYLIISLFLLIILLTYSFILSLFYYEIGTIQEKNYLCRTNCYYETLENILSELCFFSSYIIIHHLSGKRIYRIIYQGIILSNCIIIAIYFNYTVFYYNHSLNLISINGWYFTIWYLFLLLTKELIGIHNILLPLLIGWIIIGVINYFFYETKILKCLTESNIFETNSLKDIEMFSFYLIEKGNENIIESKVLLKGIITSFEEYLTNIADLNEKYQKFLDNIYLQKKFGGKESTILAIYNIIFLIYEYFFEKPTIKNDMLLIICYFLVNKLDNYTYAALLCSQIKVSDYKMMYLKYLLMEKIKKYQMYKLLQTGNKESIKHVELGSVIVYNNYLDNFKLKIYDATCSQYDYFDFLKNNQINKNLTSSFMETGEKIIKLRTEIMDIWDKIMKLNPFCEENEKDYMLYLETVIQDLELAQKEQENFIHYRNSILSQKNNLYYSLFNKDISSIMLVDGYALRGKILYSSPNFPFLFNYLQKELLNLYIYDLMPSNIASFHKKLEEDAIRLSNLTNLYYKKNKIILKGKNNNVYNITLFVKCLPNLSYGIIFILDIDKLQDKSFIFILDQNLKICSLSNVYSLSNGSDLAVTTTKVFDLNNNVIGHHIATIIPQILLQLEYKDNKFIIKKENTEIKAVLFPNLDDLSEYDNSIEEIINTIKTNGKLITEEEAKQINDRNLHESTTKASLRSRKSMIGANNKEYKGLFFELTRKFIGKTYNIFYKIYVKSFLNEKYYYYKILIDNNLMGNEDKKSEGKTVKKNNLNETKISLFNNKFNDIFDFKDKIKAIKLHVNEDTLNNEKEATKIIEQAQNNNNDNANYERSHNSFMSSSSSIDNSGYTKLKFGLMDKEQPILIIDMKISTFLFSIASIILIILDCRKIKNEFSNVNRFLEENLFFNFSKISADCFFITGTNLKLKYYHINNLCYFDSCDSTYDELLYLCVQPLKEILEHSSNYNREYQEILNKRYLFILSAYNETTKVATTFDTINILRMFLTSGLFIHHHFNDYLNNDKETHALLENIVFGAYYYIKSLTYIKGFDEKERRSLAIKKFQTQKIYLIINVIIFALVVISLVYLILKIFKEEKYFLQKLVKFQNPKFEEYLKYLENLKKKLRNDNGEDEEQQNQDENHPNNSNESEENKRLQRRGSTNSNDPRKKKLDKKKNRKKNQGKLSKLQQQKNEKIKIMTLFFFVNNLILAIELGFILLIYMTYYILINLTYNQKRNNFFDFDDTINNLEGIFKECFDIYVNVKYETLIYGGFITNQKEAISKLENGESIVEFEGKNYTDINELKKQVYTINVPDVTFNKIGNILLSIISDGSSDYNSESNQNIATQMKHLYQGNACDVLYDKSDSTYTYCLGYWSSIITQGMEQAFNQLSVELTNLQNNLILCNQSKKSFLEIIESIKFINLEYFYSYYLVDAYLKTKLLLEKLRENKVNSIFNVFKLTMYIYIAISIVLCIVLVIFIQKKKKVFCSFLNFIGIIPFQYISEDDDFYRDILRLEREIF